MPKLRVRVRNHKDIIGIMVPMVTHEDGSPFWALALGCELSKSTAGGLDECRKYTRETGLALGHNTMPGKYSMAAEYLARLAVQAKLA